MNSNFNQIKFENFVDISSIILDYLWKFLVKIKYKLLYDYIMFYKGFCAIWNKNLDNSLKFGFNLQIFVYDSSFMWTFIQKRRILSLLFYMVTRSHFMTLRRGFLLFWFFFEFCMLVWKSSQSLGHDCSHVMIEWCKYFCVSVIKWLVVNLEMKFLKNNRQDI